MGGARDPLEGEALSEDGIARQLVVDSGADAIARGVAAAPAAKDRLLVLENWSHGEAFRDIDLSAAAGQIASPWSAWKAPAPGNCYARSPGWSRVRDGSRSRAGAASGAASQRLCPATRALSLYSNFSVGEKFRRSAGKPDIAGFGLTLKEKPDASRSPLSFRS